MQYHLFRMTAAALAVVASAGLAAAQGSPQPNRNDPPPPAANRSAKDTVPPATDTSEPTRAGKQEPSSKVEGTNPDAGIFNNGVLAVPGAPSETETTPSTVSARARTADELPIAAYTLRHLTKDQRIAIYQRLHEQQAPRLAIGSPADSYSFIGAQVPTAVALNQLHALPEEIVSRLPELKGVVFVRADDRVLLVNPNLRLVVAVLTQ